VDDIKLKLDANEKMVSARAGDMVATEIFKVSKMFGMYSLSLESYLILICIVLFNRDGLQMEKQTKADLSLSHYSRLLTKYLAAHHKGKKLTSQIIDRLLSTVRESSKKLRAQVLVNL